MAAVEMKPESGAKGYAMCMQAYSYPNFGKFIKREENHEFCCTRAGIRKTLEFIEGNVPKPVNLHFQHIQLRHRLITNIVSHSYMGGELDRESLNGDDYFKQLFKIMFHNPDLKEATIAALTRDEKKAFAEYITASPKIKHIGIPFKIDVLKSISEKDYTPPEFDLNGKDELILINATIAADTFQYRARNECSNFGAKTLRELIEKPGGADAYVKIHTQTIDLIHDALVSLGSLTLSKKIEEKDNIEFLQDVSDMSFSIVGRLVSQKVQSSKITNGKT